MSRIDKISQEILAELGEDFSSRGLSAEALRSGYAGVSMTHLRDQFGHSSVDFDLALESLEKGGLAKTGPIVPYENSPHSNVFVFATYSKKEYLFLTTKGYRSLQSRPIRSSPKPSHRVQINNSTIYQSAIGAGDHLKQSVAINIESDAEVVEHLVELAESNGLSPREQIVDDVTELVASARSGDLVKAKPIFTKLYGIASSGVGQVAWGVVSAILAKQMGF